MLKVIVVMRSLFIDRTIVKGYSENVYTQDGKVSILGAFVLSLLYFPYPSTNVVESQMNDIEHWQSQPNGPQA